MKTRINTKFLYRSSNIDEKYFEKFLKQPLPFDNAEYELRISGTVETDRRIMSFVNTFWGFEVTGGYDQFEPLIVTELRRSGYAFRAGIRKNDKLTRINNVYTDDMTLSEAQLLISRSGRQHVKIFVSGDGEIEECDEYTVDFWFKPRKKFPPIHVQNKWSGGLGWNDRKKKIYKESNCFLVPSKGEEKNNERISHRPAPVVVTVSDENETDVHDTNTTNVAVTVSDENETAVHDTNTTNEPQAEVTQNGLTNGQSAHPTTNGETKSDENTTNGV